MENATPVSETPPAVAPAVEGFQATIDRLVEKCRATIGEAAVFPMSALTGRQYEVLADTVERIESAHPELAIDLRKFAGAAGGHPVCNVPLLLEAGAEFSGVPDDAPMRPKALVLLADAPQVFSLVARARRQLARQYEDGLRAQNEATKKERRAATEKSEAQYEAERRAAPFCSLPPATREAFALANELPPGPLRAAFLRLGELTASGVNGGALAPDITLLVERLARPSAVRELEAEAHAAHAERMDTIASQFPNWSKESAS